jgi:rSAM/selenodomain-associated transferase 2
MRELGDDVSVVIPTLNAAATLPATLSCLAAIDDIVVVDGGSTDATPRIAADDGGRVLSAPRGRGGQLAAGIAAARRPWLLLLHADTRLESGWRRAAATHIADPGRAAYFRFALDSTQWRAALLTRAVALRCRLFALPYGDQGLLIHRDLLQAVGGMRDLPLMEDVDLVRRLGRPRLVGLDVAAVTGAARWERDGWTSRSARNLVCLSLYFAGVKPATIARLYQ